MYRRVDLVVYLTWRTLLALKVSVAIFIFNRFWTGKKS